MKIRVKIKNGEKFIQCIACLGQIYVTLKPCR